MAKRSCERTIKRVNGRLVIRGPVEFSDGTRLSACATLTRPRESGHAHEGSVTIRGKRYSAFTDGGINDFVIVARRK